MWLTHFIRLAPLIQKALDRCNGTHTLEDIQQGLEEGRYQIWPAEDGVAITEVLQYPRKKVLFFFLMAGKMEHVLANAGKAEQVAQDLGCSSLMFNGRHGWLKSPLMAQGFKPLWVAYEKEV
jgi:hypothetical protein